MKSMYSKTCIAGYVVLTLFVAGMSLLAQSAVRGADSRIGPVGQTWYFAEGRVGGGFKQFLTVDNPGPSACNVSIDYLYTVDGSSTDSTKVVMATIPAVSRFTESVNSDLHFSEMTMSTGANVSAIVSVDNGGNRPLCHGVVVERPMYFYFHGIQSGTDTMGTTHEGLSRHFFFASVPVGNDAESFLSVLNPNSTAANVKVAYIADGNEIAHQTLSVPVLARGTFQPNTLHLASQNVAAVVTSDQDILVERPTYFKNRYNVSGAANVAGMSDLGSFWHFAEGTTEPGVHEDLLIANLGRRNTTALVTLLGEQGNPVLPAVTVPIPARTQIVWNVNAHMHGQGRSVAASVTELDERGSLVVQRQMFSTYHGQNGANTGSGVQTSWSAAGASDTFGAIGTHSAYTFAEGFNSTYYNEWLSLVNTTRDEEHISVKLDNMLGHTYTQHITLPARHQLRENLTNVVEQHLVATSEGAAAFATSMTVFSDNPSDRFVAERTMYFHTPPAYSVQGVSSIVGYFGD